MNKYFNFFAFTFWLLAFSALTHAEIYKHVDADGRVTYSNVKIKGAKKLNLEPADTNFGTAGEGARRPSSSGKEATPANFPKVDANTQKQRDASRKEVLQAELDNERAALAAAQKAYAEGEANPEMVKNKDGKMFRNMARFEEKMKPLREEVEMHQRNVDLLEKEISSLN